MASQQSEKTHNAFQKTLLCVALSAFYFAMLAWPFGLTSTGYMASRAFMAGAIMFAISIPVWIINIRREFYSNEAAVANTAELKAQSLKTIDQLALDNQWLSPADIKQIMFCQKADGESFENVAVKRNFLTLSQVRALLDMQSSIKKEISMQTVNM